MKVARCLAAALLVATACLVARADFGEGLRWLARGQFGNAYRELKEAAEQGNVSAAKTLGWMLERGMRVQGGQTLEARPAEAAQWYRRAAEAGDTHSMGMLGVLYTSGHGVPRDFGEALRWFDNARGAGAAERTLAVYDKYPAEERPEIAAWALAVTTAFRREVRFPRGAQIRNSWGRVKLEFDAATATPRVTETDAIAIIVNATEQYARLALDAAPPTPAAIREKIAVPMTVDYQLRDD